MFSLLNNLFLSNLIFYFDDFVNNPHRRACKMVEHMKTHILGKKISSVKTFLIFFFRNFIHSFCNKTSITGKNNYLLGFT